MKWEWYRSDYRRLSVCSRQTSRSVRYVLQVFAGWIWFAREYEWVRQVLPVYFKLGNRFQQVDSNKLVMLELPSQPAVSFDNRSKWLWYALTLVLFWMITLCCCLEICYPRRTPTHRTKAQLRIPLPINHQYPVPKNHFVSLQWYHRALELDKPSVDLVIDLPIHEEETSNEDSPWCFSRVVVYLRRWCCCIQSLLHMYHMFLILYSWWALTVHCVGLHFVSTWQYVVFLLDVLAILLYLMMFPLLHLRKYCLVHRCLLLPRMARACVFLLVLLCGVATLFSCVNVGRWMKRMLRRSSWPSNTAAVYGGASWMRWVV